MRTWLIACLLVTSQSALAQSGTEDEFAGVRSTAMGGAHRGVGTSNDTLYLNPAGMAVQRRYAVEMQYGYSPFDHLTHINTSVVDSKTGPVAGAIGYTHDRSDNNDDVRLHRMYLGAGYLVGNALAFGFTNRYVKGQVRGEDGEMQDISAYTADAGLMLAAGDTVTLGVAYNNLVRPSGSPGLLPPTLGFGAGLHAGPLTLGADVDRDMRDDVERPWSYRAGGEYFAAGAFPLRLGYERVPFTNAKGALKDENILSFGAGWLSEGGALDVGYRRSTNRSDNWTFVGALRFFM